MTVVSVSELRRNLPAYLARAQRGERIRVTSRGKAVAELSLPTADRTDAAAARKLLAGSVLQFEHPLEPALDEHEWDINR